VCDMVKTSSWESIIFKLHIVLWAYFLIKKWFHTYVCSLCIQNDILHLIRPFSWKTSIVRHLRPKCHIMQNTTFK
jgi:hypothetical protein